MSPDVAARLHAQGRAFDHVAPGLKVVVDQWLHPGTVVVLGEAIDLTPEEQRRLEGLVGIDSALEVVRIREERASAKLTSDVALLADVGR